MTFLGWLSDPFQWLSDFQLGDEKVTLNHLEVKKLFKVSRLATGSSNVFFDEIFGQIFGDGKHEFLGPPKR